MYLQRWAKRGLKCCSMWLVSVRTDTRTGANILGTSGIEPGGVPQGNAPSAGTAGNKNDILIEYTPPAFDRKLPDAIVIRENGVAEKSSSCPPLPAAQSSSAASKRPVSSQAGPALPVKCYIITTREPADASKMLNNLGKLPDKIRFAYRKYVTGVSFCTGNHSFVNNLKSSYTGIDIEEDKLFRIGSQKSGSYFSRRMPAPQTRKREDGTGSQKITANRTPGKNTPSVVRRQSYVPLHFFRMKNMGNLVFNNYLLDNFIFRITRINHLIKYFYSYSYLYSGENVVITKIDVDGKKQCNRHGNIVSSLLVGSTNGLAKRSSLVNVGGVECDGTIWLSKLLHVLETVNDTDILLLPFSGPHSDVLDASLQKLGQRAIIVSAAGDEGENSCNYSPGGHSIIKVGSVGKNGGVSSFSNRGGCNRIYALGEDIMNDSGTSIAGRKLRCRLSEQVSEVVLSKRDAVPEEQRLDKPKIASHPADARHLSEHACQQDSFLV